MSQIAAILVKELREKTGAGFMECKGALTEVEGDIGKAEDLLRKRGVSSKRTERATMEGTICTYTHSNGKISATVELRCESDFVARNKDFLALAHNLCLHVAGSPTPPIAIRREDISADVVEAERTSLQERDDITSKPEGVQGKIIEGRMRKFYEECALLEQPFVKDDKLTVKALIDDHIKTIKENIVLAGFVRWTLGHDPVVARNGVVDEQKPKED